MRKLEIASQSKGTKRKALNLLFSSSVFIRVISASDTERQKSKTLDIKNEEILEKQIFFHYRMISPIIFVIDFSRFTNYFKATDKTVF